MPSRKGRSRPGGVFAISPRMVLGHRSFKLAHELGLLALPLLPSQPVVTIRVFVRDQPFRFLHGSHLQRAGPLQVLSQAPTPRQTCVYACRGVAFVESSGRRSRSPVTLPRPAVGAQPLRGPRRLRTRRSPRRPSRPGGEPPPRAGRPLPGDGTARTERRTRRRAMARSASGTSERWLGSSSGLARSSPVEASPGWCLRSRARTRASSSASPRDRPFHRHAESRSGGRLEPSGSPQPTPWGRRRPRRAIVWATARGSRRVPCSRGRRGIWSPGRVCFVHGEARGRGEGSGRSAPFGPRAGREPTASSPHDRSTWRPRRRFGWRRGRKARGEG